MELKDTTTKGFFAGVIGGVLMNIVSYLSYYLNIASLRFLDWPSIIITGHVPTNAFSVLFFLIVQIIFVGFLGSVFALLVARMVTSTNHIFKGILFAILSWFAIYGITYIADVPKLTPLTMGTAVTDFIGAIVFGVTLSETLNRLDAGRQLPK